MRCVRRARARAHARVGTPVPHHTRATRRLQRTGPALFQTCPDGNYFAWHAMAIGARSQSAKTYLEKHYKEHKTLARDDLIREAVRALHTCTETDKDLTIENTVIGVVGADEKFHVLEGDEVAPFLVGLAGVERGMAVEDDAAAAAGAAAVGGAAAAGAAPPAGGAGADDRMDEVA